MGTGASQRDPAVVGRAPWARVIVVDPDDGTRAATAQLLIDAGCAVEAAVGSHAQAMLAVRQHQPDVIVTELRGGIVLTGSAYVQALHGQCPTAAVVLYATVLPAPSEVATWRVASWLVKVVDADVLPMAVRAALRAGRPGR